MVTVYNPLGYETNQFVRFPVEDGIYEVRNSSNNLIESELVPIPEAILDLPYRESTTTKELVFQASKVPAIGYKAFYVERTSDLKSSHRRAKVLDEVLEIGDEEFGITIGTDGLLSQVTIDGVTSNLGQNFMFYQGAAGNNGEFANRSSGAYIFRPDPEAPETLIGEVVEIDFYPRANVDEVHQKFNDWVSQVVRVYKTQKVVEFEWLVGPIPVNDEIGKEIVSRFYSEIASDGVFYTDTNGRETLKRIRNFRKDFTLTLEEPDASNYYPITTKIAIEDETYRLAVLTDRAQGGSSLIDGTLELMVHRRLLRDDAFGVGEALNEEAFGQGLVARGKHWLIFGRKTETSPTLKGKYKTEHTTIGGTLPPKVHFMTYEPWSENSFLVRFEHVLELNEDPEESKPATFNLADIFPGDLVFTEMTLAANQEIGELNRLQFKSEGSVPSEESAMKQNALAEDSILTLKPMQIATIIVSTRSEDTTLPPTATEPITTTFSARTTQQAIETTTGLGIRSQSVLGIVPTLFVILFLNQIL